MDAFSLALFYGISKVSFYKAFLTAITVGLFHFFMPLLGNMVGYSIFQYTLFKPKIVLFIVFLLLSADMFIHFFEEKPKIRPLNILGIIIFSFSVSFDSFSVGLGISYLYNNIIMVVAMFCLISMVFTMTGFMLGKILSEKIGKYAFLIGGITLFTYSIVILTK